LPLKTTFLYKNGTGFSGAIFCYSSAEVLFAEQLFPTGTNVVADTLRPITRTLRILCLFSVKN
jgi:hypothetical protein